MTVAGGRRQFPYLTFLTRSPEKNRTSKMLMTLQKRERSDRSCADVTEDDLKTTERVRRWFTQDPT